MVRAHGENHGQEGHTLFRSRPHAWIIQGRKLAKEVVADCWWCHGQIKDLLQQQMSDLPEERLNIPSMLFTNTGIDFLGGYEVRAMNNARCKVKTFPMLFSCLNAGALHAELSHNYSTDAFLTCYASYTAIRGNPITV